MTGMRVFGQHGETGERPREWEPPRLRGREHEGGEGERRREVMLERRRPQRAGDRPEREGDRDDRHASCQPKSPRLDASSPDAPIYEPRREIVAVESAAPFPKYAKRQTGRYDGTRND
jgi:hypothetical protein